MLQFITTDETWVHYYTLETKQQEVLFPKGGCSINGKDDTGLQV